MEESFLDKILEHFHGEWIVISGAPVLTCLVGVIIAAVTWLYAKHYFGGRLETLQERIDLHKERAESSESYKAVSPKKAIDPDEWPSLTDEQITQWTKTLEPFQIAQLLIWYENQIDAQKIFKSFQKIGENLKAKVSHASASLSVNSQLSVQANHEVCAALEDLCNKVGTTEFEKMSHSFRSVRIWIGKKRLIMPSSLTPP